MITNDNPKTLARREQMRIKYADLDKNEDFVVHPSQIDLSSYHYSKGNNIVITYESDIDGMYCHNPDLLYKNSKNNAEHITCMNIFWTCNDCVNCDKRRKLHIMKQIDKRFRYHTHIKEFYSIECDLVDNTMIQHWSKHIKYMMKKNNLLMWIQPDSERVIFILEGNPEGVFIKEDILTKEDILNMVQVKDKYRFLGKWYNKVPEVEFAGMTEEEIKELSKIKAIPKERCDCGTLMSDHVIRKIHSQSDFDKYLVPTKEYEEEHIKFKKKYNI